MIDLSHFYFCKEGIEVFFLQFCVVFLTKAMLSLPYMPLPNLKQLMRVFCRACV